MSDDLLPVDRVRERILADVEPILPIQLPLTEAYGCVLAEDLDAPFEDRKSTRLNSSHT